MDVWKVDRENDRLDAEVIDPLIILQNLRTASSSLIESGLANVAARILLALTLIARIIDWHSLLFPFNKIFTFAHLLPFLPFPSLSFPSVADALRRESEFVRVDKLWIVENRRRQWRNRMHSSLASN